VAYGNGNAEIWYKSRTDAHSGEQGQTKRILPSLSLYMLGIRGIIEALDVQGSLTVPSLSSISLYISLSSGFQRRVFPSSFARSRKSADRSAFRVQISLRGA